MKPLLIKDRMYWTGFGGLIGAAQLKPATKTDKNCKDIWVKEVDSIVGIASGTRASVRATPAYYTRIDRVTGKPRDTLLYVGISNIFSIPFPLWFTTPAFAFALDAETGDLVWILNTTTPGEADVPFPAATSSPRVENGVAYFGQTSFQGLVEGILQTGNPLTARGRMLALDLDAKGTNVPPGPFIKWDQFTIPKRPAGWVGNWFAGSSVWASAPTFIKGEGKNGKGLIAFSSGNLYIYPNFTADCMTTPEPVVTPEFSTTQRGETYAGAKVCYCGIQGNFSHNIF